MEVEVEVEVEAAHEGLSGTLAHGFMRGRGLGYWRVRRQGDEDDQLLRDCEIEDWGWDGYTQVGASDWHRALCGLRVTAVSIVKADDHDL